jgi:hypothetical protein
VNSGVCDVVISRTKVASVLASIRGCTGGCAVAVMNMVVVRWKGGGGT